MITYGEEQKDVRCGDLDAHTPHSWGIKNGLYCNGKGLGR